MSDRQKVTGRVVIAGQGYSTNLIHNPTIEDVLVTEAQLQAYVLTGGSLPSGYRVSRDIRDFLIRLGVER